MKWARSWLDDIPILQHDGRYVQAAAKHAISQIEAEYIVRRRSRVGQGSSTTAYTYSLVEAKDGIAASVSYRIHRDSAHWTLVVSDDSFKAVEVWRGDARPQGSGHASIAFGTDEVEQIRVRGKFVAFLLTNGDGSTPTPKTMSQWESAIPGFTDIAAEIRQLDPGQTKSVGPWCFPRIIR